MVRVNLELSEELARVAGLDGKDGPAAARLLILLELYREGRLSFGRLAELSGLPQAELLDRMSEHGTYLNYTLEDLDQDRRALPA